ncbi:hypothetical protein pb186bvf_011418 [Paramecium bursaria]
MIQAKNVMFENYSKIIIKAIRGLQETENTLFDKVIFQGKQFINGLTKNDDHSIYSDIVAFINNLIKWKQTRLQLLSSDIEKFDWRRANQTQVHDKEKFISIEVMKSDISSINQLREEFVKLTIKVKGLVQTNNVQEYQIINQICQENKLNYPLILASLLQVKENKEALQNCFNEQGKPRGFIFEFFYKYTKRRVMQMEIQFYIFQYLQTCFQSFRELSNKIITQICENKALQVQQYSIYNVLQIHLESYDIIEKFIDTVFGTFASLFTQLKNRYGTYMQIIVETQGLVEKDHYHDQLMESFSVQIANLIQANVVRDVSFNQYLLDVLVYIDYQLDYLRKQIQKNLKTIVSNVDENSHEDNVIIQRFDQQWNKMLHQESKLEQLQLDEYKVVLINRKNSYINEPSRFKNNPKTKHFWPYILPISIKEVFQIFFSDDTLFFTQFRQSGLNQNEIRYTKYEPEAPEYYQNLESGKIHSIIQQNQTSKRVLHFKEMKSSTFSKAQLQEYKQEEFIFFINSKEFMIEQEQFLQDDDSFTIQRYYHIIEQSDKCCEINYGYYRQKTKLSFMSIFDFEQYEQQEKEIWTQKIQPFMLKTVQEYMAKKESMILERKKSYALNQNLEQVLKNKSKSSFSQLFQTQQQQISPERQLHQSAAQVQQTNMLYNQDTYVRALLFILMIYTFLFK